MADAAAPKITNVFLIRTPSYPQMPLTMRRFR